MENGLIINAMDMVNMLIIRMLNIRDIGRMIVSMDMVSSLGLMDLTLRDIIKRELNLAKGNIFGRINQDIKENGKIIKLMVLVIISGKMVDSILDNG